MKPKIIVSGDRQFIARYRALFELIKLQCSQLDYVYGDELFETPFFNKLVKVFQYCFSCQIR